MSNCGVTGENTGMGLSTKLKAQSRLLLSIAIIVIVIVGVGIAFVALSVPAQRAAVEDVFVDDVYADDSDAGGEVDITTILRDDKDIIIRKTDPDAWAMPFAIVDPTTSTEVGSYGIELDFTCWGKNIDWSTFVLEGTWMLSNYIGVDDFGNAFPDTEATYTAFETLDIINPPASSQPDGKEGVSGTLTFQTVAIDSLMPDYIYPPQGGGEMFTQRTAWSHEMTFVFDASFSLYVEDDWGNVYDSDYDVHIGLVLVWEGSDFGIEWEPETTETYDTTGIELPPEPDPTDTTIEPPPIDIRDDFGDPCEEPTSDESVYITNTATQDVIAASFTGATGSLIVVVVVIGILLPVVAYWQIKKK